MSIPTPPDSDITTEDHFLLAVGLRSASLFLGLAEEAIRHSPVSDHISSEDIGAMNALVFLNECTSRNSAIQHGLAAIAQDLKRVHLAGKQANAADSSSKL